MQDRSRGAVVSDRVSAEIRANGTKLVTCGLYQAFPLRGFHNLRNVLNEIGEITTGWRVNQNSRAVIWVKMCQIRTQVVSQGLQDLDFVYGFLTWLYVCLHDQRKLESSKVLMCHSYFAAPNSMLAFLHLPLAKSISS
jgi:hypothetical protein